MNRFHDRYEALRRLGAAEWGRTTCFDLLVRAGVLEIGGNAYGPDRVYLEGSTGPGRGFQLVWCISVEHRNAERCEKLLRQTDEAREDLTVILDQSDASKEQSLRLVEGNGQYRFAVDQEREDDQTFKHQDRSVLLVAQEVAAALDGATLERAPEAEGGQPRLTGDEGAS